MAKKKPSLDDNAEARLKLLLVQSGLSVLDVAVPAPAHVRPGQPDHVVEREDGVRVLVTYTGEPSNEQKVMTELRVKEADLRPRRSKSVLRIARELEGESSGGDAVKEGKLLRLAAALIVAQAVEQNHVYALKQGFTTDGGELPEERE